MSTVKQKYLRDENNEVFSPIVSIDSVHGGGLSLLDLFYPVGSYYETSNSNFDPNVNWGGTWEQDTQGYVTVGAGSNSTAPIKLSVGNKTGSANHSITTSEMPSHNHAFTGTSHSHTFTGTAHTHVFTGKSHTHTYEKSNATSGSHTLTINEIPSHNHINKTIGRGTFHANNDLPCPIDYSRTDHTSTFNSSSTGGGKGHTHPIVTTSTNSGTTTSEGTNASVTATGSISDTTASGTIGSTGSGTAMSLVQPSIRSNKMAQNCIILHNN